MSSETKGTIKHQQKSDKALKIFLIIFVIGYFFFFTSNYTMPKVYKNIVPTEMSETLDMGNYSVTLDSWDYCKKEHEMLAIFEISNITLEEDVDVKFTGTAGEDVFSTEIIKRVGDYYVVSFKGVPRRWSTASITISIEGNQGKVLTTDEFVNTTDTINKEMTDTEVLVYATESKIEGLQNRIKKCRKEKKKIENKLDYSVEKIDELEARKKTETEEEQQKTGEDISKISNDAENLTGDLNDVLEEIYEYQSKITVLQKYLAELQRGE